MITPKTHATVRVACLLLGILLLPTGLSSVACAATGTAADTTVSATDLERLAQQIADPGQRDQLLKNLQALTRLARQGHVGVPAPGAADGVADHSQGLFFAFGELTQRLAASGRRIIGSSVAIPAKLAELPTRLRDPATLWSVTTFVLAATGLVIAGFSLQLATSRLESKLRARVAASEPRHWWRKVWLALLFVGLAAAPCVALLALGGIVFSVLPVGVIPVGLAVLVICTLLLYRVLHAVAGVLLGPDRLNIRLLPIDDSTAPQLWRWVSRLITLSVAYFFITHALLTIGVAAELFQVVRGAMILVIASLVSAMLSRLGRTQRAADIASEGDLRHPWSGVWAALRRLWPILTIAYVWCAALLAVLSFHHEWSFLLTTALQMTLLIGAGLALFWGVDVFFNHAAALNERVERYIPGLERRTRRYLRALWWSSRSLIVLVVFLCLLQIWGVGIARLMASPLGTGLLSRLVALGVTAAAVVFVMDLSTFVGQRLVEPTPAGVQPGRKRKTLVPLMAAVIKYGALIVGGLIVLHLVGVNITPILAGVGILSLAVGFGAQTLVKDIINGLFILVEDSIAVGDVVTIRGTGGLVEAVNVRTIRLRDLQGNVHIIPNSQVDMITNMTMDYAYYVLDVNVAYHEDTERVVAALQEIDAEMRADPAFAADMLAPIEILGLERFTDSAVVLRARLKTKPIKQWSVGREFNRRMKKLFDARGIETPFSQRTVS